jgi:hypothetical protein
MFIGNSSLEGCFEVKMSNKVMALSGISKIYLCLTDP